MSVAKIYVNTRNTFSSLSGVQRYTIELTRRMGDDLEQIYPSKPMSGIPGHLWEQIALPVLLEKKALLWSPANIGPLTVSHQVVTIHDMSVFDAPQGFNKFFSFWYQSLLPRLVHKVQKIICVSNFSKEKIIEHCKANEENIVVVHNGVDLRFKPENNEKVEHIRKELGIPSPNYLIALGSLEPRKNLVRLIKAWEIIQSKLPSDIWLVIAGARGKANIFAESSLINLPPRVYLTDFVSDEELPSLYSGAIASPYLSTYEGFGLPPLEAMACGTPTITGNLTSLPEIIGDAGILVNPYDIEAIADNLFRIVNDTKLRKSLRTKGLDHVKSYSWDKTAKLTRQVLIEAATS